LERERLRVLSFRFRKVSGERKFRERKTPKFAKKEEPCNGELRASAGSPFAPDLGLAKSGDIQAKIRRNQAWRKTFRDVVVAKTSRNEASG